MFRRDLGYGKPVYESRRSGKGTRYIEILRLQIDPAAQSGTQGKRIRDNLRTDQSGLISRETVSDAEGSEGRCRYIRTKRPESGMR